MAFNYNRCTEIQNIKEQIMTTAQDDTRGDDTRGDGTRGDDTCGDGTRP